MIRVGSWIEAIQMLACNCRRQCRLEHFTNRSEIVVGDPSAKIENVRQEQGGTVQYFGYGLNFDAGRRSLREPYDKAFDFPVAESNSNAASDFSGFSQFIDKGARQRQANGDVGKHESEPQPKQLSADLFHVFPDLALLFRRTQEVDGVECRNHPHPVDVVEFSAKHRYGICALKHGLRGKLSKTADDFRTDGGDLALQEGAADENFVRLRIAISRRTAFEDVADVSVLALDADRFDDLRQQPARFTN